MKRGAPDHPKMFALAEALGVRRAMAVGIIEMMIHFTAQYCPEGDIGRYGNKRIAGALDWSGNADKLIEALVRTGWLDRDDRLGLVVHDWSDHADRTTLQRLSRAGKSPIKSNQEVTRKLCTQPETNNSPLPEPEPEPIPEPVPEPTSAARAPHAAHRTPAPTATPKIAVMPSLPSEWPHSAAFVRCWDRHCKHRGRTETYATVAQVLIGMDSLDWGDLEQRHERFADYWARKGWDFCPMTLLEWVQNGMPPPPPEPKREEGGRNESRSERIRREMREQ